MGRNLLTSEDIQRASTSRRARKRHKDALRSRKVQAAFKMPRRVALKLSQHVRPRIKYLDFDVDMAEFEVAGDGWMGRQLDEPGRQWTLDELVDRKFEVLKYSNK